MHFFLYVCSQPPLANLDSMFLYIEDVIDVSGRLLSLLDQKQVQSGDPLFLETLCEGYNFTFYSFSSINPQTPALLIRVIFVSW